MAEKAKFDREAAFKSIIGAGRQSENAVVAEAKNAKRNNDRVQRAYYLDRDVEQNSCGWIVFAAFCPGIWICEILTNQEVETKGTTFWYIEG